MVRPVFCPTRVTLAAPKLLFIPLGFCGDTLSGMSPSYRFKRLVFTGRLNVTAKPLVNGVNEVTVNTGFCTVTLKVEYCRSPPPYRIR